MNGKRNFSIKLQLIACLISSGILLSMSAVDSLQHMILKRDGIVTTGSIIDVERKKYYKGAIEFIIYYEYIPKQIEGQSNPEPLYGNTRITKEEYDEFNRNPVSLVTYDSDFNNVSSFGDLTKKTYLDILAKKKYSYIFGIILFSIFLIGVKIYRKTRSA